MFKKYFFEIGIYLLVFFPMFLISGLFWDDWVFYNQPNRLPSLWELGRPYLDPLFSLGDIMVEPISLPRWGILFSYLLSCLFAVKWVKGLYRVGEANARVLLLIFLLLPLCFSRTHNAILHYFLSLQFFVMGHYILLPLFNSTQMRRREEISRLAAFVILSFLAFTTNSFLVFHYFVLFLYFLASSSRWNRLSEIAAFLMRPQVVLLVALPVVFFALNKLFFAPYGEYAGYNQIKISSLPGAIVQTLIFCIKAPLMVFKKYPTKSWEFWLLVPAFSFVFSVWIKQFNVEEISLKWSKKSLLIVGAGLFCALFPYLLVNVRPTVEGWDSRHLMTAMLPVGFLIFLGLSYIKLKYQKVALVLLLAVFSSKNVVRYGEALMDGFVQEATILQLSQSQKVKRSDVILLDESSRPFLSIDRLSSFYEVSHYVEAALPGGTRFGINAITGRFSQSPEEWRELVLRYHSKKDSFASFSFDKNKTDMMFAYVSYKPLIEKSFFYGYYLFVLKLIARESFLQKINSLFLLEAHFLE